MNKEELMDINEAIKRIEYEIEEDLKNKEVTIAGRIDIERIKQMQAELDNKDKQLELKDKTIEAMTKHIYNYCCDEPCIKHCSSLKDCGLNCIVNIKKHFENLAKESK